jgi:hypothetical protein
MAFSNVLLSSLSEWMKELLMVRCRNGLREGLLAGLAVKLS